MNNFWEYAVPILGERERPNIYQLMHARTLNPLSREVNQQTALVRKANMSDNEGGRKPKNCKCCYTLQASPESVLNWERPGTMGVKTMSVLDKGKKLIDSYRYCSFICCAAPGLWSLEVWTTSQIEYKLITLGWVFNKLSLIHRLAHWKLLWLSRAAQNFEQLDAFLLIADFKWPELHVHSNVGANFVQITIQILEIC